MLPCLGYCKQCCNEHGDVCILSRILPPSGCMSRSGIIGAFVVLLLSHVCVLVTPWTAACQASLSFTISRSLLKLMSIVSVTPSNHLILCHPLFLPSIFPSISVSSQYQGLFFSFSISPSNEYSRLISFRNDWFGLLVFQGALKSLLQHHN